MARPTREEAEAKRSASRETSGRKGRHGLGGLRSKLSAPAREGYVRRWVNDSEGRLLSAQEEDYQFVMDNNMQIGSPDVDNVNRDLGSRVSRVVDKMTGQRAYLMEIKKEYYDEYQAEKAAKVAETDERIRKGKLDDGDSRYIPDKGQGINIETRNT